MKRLVLSWFKKLKCGIRKILYKVYLRVGIYVKNTDAQYLHVFNRVVEQKVKALGLENSRFLVPSGASADENYATARDILRIMAFALQYADLQKVLSCKTRDIHVMGNNSRKVTVENTVRDSTIGDVFPILASKTGSWGTDWFNLAVVTEIENKRVVAVIMGAVTHTSRYESMKELLDISATLFTQSQRNTAKASVTKAPIAISAVIESDSNVEVLYEKRADEKCNPASLTKIMTAMVVLDHINELNEILTYKYIDMSRRTDLLVPNDSLTVEDALYDMLLPSSNQSAQALARFTGKKIQESTK